MSRKFPKEVYYVDPLQEFEINKLERRDLPDDFDYLPKKSFKDFFWKMLYFCATPLLNIISILFMHLKVKNKKELKKLRKQGFFVYMNHTSDRDPFILQTKFFRHRFANITGYSDALSLPIIHENIMSIGLIPLPNSIRGLRKFNKDLEKAVIALKRPVIIFPERQMWPYCSQLRDFNDSTFHYPSAMKAPVLPIVTVYRKSFGYKHFDSKPHPMIVVGNAIYYDQSKTPQENKVYMHSECVRQMKEMIEKYNEVEYIKYIKTDADDPRAIKEKKVSLKKLYKEEKKKNKSNK